LCFNYHFYEIVLNERIGNMIREYISFPGLNIDWFGIKKSFPLFNSGKEIAWYGVIICVGIILAVIYSMYRAKKENIRQDDVIDLAFFLVMFGIAGARLFYVIAEYDKTFVGSFKQIMYNIVSVWEGGLSILGALIAGFVTILVFCRVKKINAFQMLDIVAPAVMIGQIIGRWGNFVNVEVYGLETTLPWRMGIHRCVLVGQTEDLHASGLCSGVESFVHPLFLYESLWNLLGFIVANLIFRKKKFNGQIVTFYFMWYGLGRLIFEGMRNDQYILQQGGIRISQLIALAMLLAGIALTVLLYVRAKKQTAALIDGAFAPVENSEATESEESVEEIVTDSDSNDNETDEKAEEK